MEIVIASGKGGVGKSTISASLAVLFSKEKEIQLIDADVDCPDLQYLFKGKELFRKPMYLSKVAEIDKSKDWKKCINVCPFNAIDEKGNVDKFACEGCGLCVEICPEVARLKKTLTGYVVKRDVGFPLIFGELEPGQANSGMLVDELKKLKEEKEVTIVDSAAGIGCPVISSIRDSDIAILVTEPTYAAIDDLKRVLELVNHFNIPSFLIINKSNMPGTNKEIVEKFARENGIEIIGEIPFDKSAFEAISNGKPLVLTDSPLKKNIEDIYKRLREKIWK